MPLDHETSYAVDYSNNVSGGIQRQWVTLAKYCSIRTPLSSIKWADPS